MTVNGKAGDVYPMESGQIHEIVQFRPYAGFSDVGMAIFNVAAAPAGVPRLRKSA